MKLADVANRARVSTATVSRALNKTGYVSNRTRAQIMKAVQELKYRPNIYAQTLAGGQSRTLGMIVSNFENPFFMDILRAMDSEARRHGYEVLVATTDYLPGRLVSCLHLMMGRRVAGLAVIVSEMERSLVQELTQTKLPVVLYDVGTRAPCITNIKVNYAKGVQKAVAYLYSLGHRRMAFVGHHTRLEPLLDRKDSFVETMDRYKGKVEFATITDQDGPVGGQQATRALLSSGFQPTAIICVNDYMALGVLKELHDHGLSVPAQVSVIGYDNISLSEYAYPPLTTLDIPRERIGRLAFAALLPQHAEIQLEGREYLIDPELVIRESTGAVPHADLSEYTNQRTTKNLVTAHA